MANQIKPTAPPKQLKIAVGFIIAILFVLGIIQLAQGFIDTHNYSDRIIAAIEKQTNRKVTIKGAVTVSLLPTPTLFIPGLELRDPASDTPAPAVSIDMASIRVPLMSLFSKDLRITSVELDHPVFELVNSDDNRLYNDWANSSPLKIFTENNGGASNTVTVTINDGKILYLDPKTEKTITVEKIGSTVAIGKGVNAGGAFQIAGHALTFTMNTTPISDKDNKDMESFLLKVNSGANDTLELKGNVSMADKLPDIKGAFALKVDNAIDWVKAIRPQEHPLLQQVANKLAQKNEDKSPLAIDISSDWSSHGLTVEMSNFILKGLGSDGLGKINLTWKEWQPNVTADIKFSILNYDQWSQMLTATFTDNNGDTIVYHEVNEVANNPIPTNVNINLNLKADEIHYGAQIWKAAQMGANIGKGSVTVNQFNVQLQGQSVITVFGIISPSPTGDLRFEGSMETRGKSLRETLTVFDETAADLPETGFGDFFAHSNLFISSQQLRLSEADVKLGDLHLTGGLVAYFDTNPRIEADLKLKNINFDYFRDVWRTNQKNSGNKDDFFLKFDKTMNFNWLKKLQTAIDFKVSVEHFTFLDRNGDNASFRLYAKNGDLGLYDINFIYPTDITKGNFKLNVNGEQPAIILNLTTSELNTDYFNVERYKPGAVIPVANEKTTLTLPASNGETVKKLEITPQSETILLAANEDIVAPPRSAVGVEDLITTKDKTNPNIIGENKKHWSEKLLDMSWLNGYSGELELNIGKVTHKDIAIGNLKLKASFGKDLVIFRTFNFSYWGGQCGILGSLYGGKVPGFSISFTIVDAQVQSFLSSFTNRQNISGQMSISASLASSGVNILSWISQAEGKVVLIGRNIYVEGLNMQGVVDSVAISRTSSDVLNSVDHSIFNGFTIFSIDGNLNIKNGMIRTPGIGLRTTSTIGNLTGELKMVPWTLELSSLFQFPSMSTETVPTMTIQYSGTPDSGELKTDTSSLESFVAKRIISQ